MGITGLLKELCGGNMEDQRGFLTLNILCGLAQRPANIDAGTLVFVSAYVLRHNEYNAGRYLPVLRKFQRKITLPGPGPRRGEDRTVSHETYGHRPRLYMKARTLEKYIINSRVSGEGHSMARA